MVITERVETSTLYNTPIQKVFATATISKIPRILNTIPYVAIVLMETTPELMAMALGGVAIGSIKA